MVGVKTMENENFKIGMRLMLTALQRYLIKTNEEEFSYFLLNIEDLIDEVTIRKGIKVTTK